MESRQIKIYSTLNQDFITISSDVTTWGALKAIPEVKKLLTSDMQGLIKSTKTTLDHNDATLPAEPFTLFLLPQKSKGGGSVDPEVAENVGNLLDELDSAIEDVVSIAKDLKEVVNTSLVSEADALKKEAEKIRAEMGV